GASLLPGRAVRARDRLRGAREPGRAADRPRLPAGVARPRARRSPRRDHGPRPRPDRGHLRPPVCAADGRRGPRRRRRSGLRVRAQRGLGAGLALLALAACGGGSKSPFAYDRSAPLGFHDFGVVNVNYPIKFHDVSFASPKGGRARVFLVVPPGKGPFPAVIYAHGSGENRLSNLAQAAWFAARGAVALVMDDPFDRNPALRTASDARQRAAIVQEVTDMRRAVDVLQSRPYVD